MSYLTKRFLQSKSSKRNSVGVWCKNTPIQRYLQENCAVVMQDYSPPSWCSNAHFQLALTFLVPHYSMEYQRDLIKLEDGGQIALDWACNTHTKKLDADCPLLIVLHGLTGSSEGMRSMCAIASAAGYRPVVMNKRGHGGTPLSTPLLQAFGCVKDLSVALDDIKSKYPRSRLVGIGYSAGSGLLVSYVGEKGKDSLLDAGVCVSPGYDAYELFCAGGIMSVYNRLMTKSLQSLASQHHDTLKDVVDMEKVASSKSIAEVDTHLYVKPHGYDSLEDYWEHNNPMRKYSNVAVPILCINALDDPVCTEGMIPYDLFTQHENFMLRTTMHGSHCAFYHGQWFQLDSWANHAAIDYLNHVLHYTENSGNNTIFCEQSSQ